MNTFEDKFRQAAETDRLNNLGVIEFKRGNVNGAISYYEQALNVMPQNDDALVNLASCYNKIGRYDEAIQLCNKAIIIDPNRPNGYRTIGDAYYYQSDMINVVKWYRESARRGDISTRNWLENNGY